MGRQGRRPPPTAHGGCSYFDANALSRGSREHNFSADRIGLVLPGGNTEQFSLWDSPAGGIACHPNNDRRDACPTEKTGPQLPPGRTSLEPRRREASWRGSAGDRAWVFLRQCPKHVAREPAS
jgi:hypothetical protein